MQSTKERLFTPYQVFMIVIIALLQFTIILDFMVLNPLGEILLTKFHFDTQQFGLVVSAYAISAGISSFLAAGFADKFDRKKMLMLFYGGFLVGTLLCGMVNTYETLLGARIVTGVFGGVVGGISMAIIADVFAPQTRGRVMGFIQMAFGLSQILGIPIGWELANRYNWHAPFWMIGLLGIPVGIIMIIYMKPVTAHLDKKTDKNAFHHLVHTLRNPDYLLAFLTTLLLSVGGYMMMPFGSAFSTHNMGLSKSEITWLFISSGLLSFIFGPLVGKMADKVGRLNTFYIATLITAVMVYIYTNLGHTPLWLAMVISGLMFLGVFGRMIPSQAIMTSMPALHDRGAFMSINASLQQFSGGIAAAVAGKIVYYKEGSAIQHYDRLGYVMIVAFSITTVMMYLLNRQLQNKAQAPQTDAPTAMAH